MSLTTLDEPVLKRARKSDYVVSIVHPEGLDVIEDWESLEVLCVSQTIRSVSDAALGGRSCLMANSNAEGPLKIRGTPLDEFMVIHYNYMQMLICFEAYKILEQDFSEILRSYGGLMEHRAFIHDFSKVAQRAAMSHKVALVKGATWVETVPFGVFAEGITILYAFEASSESGKQKSLALVEQAESLFKEVMDEGFKALEEESASLTVNLKVLEALKASPVEGLVREWAESARNRVHRNALGHPFGPSSPQTLRKAAMKFYNQCLHNEITKGFRNVAELGRVKLEIIDHKLSQSANMAGSTLKESDIFLSDSSEDEEYESWA